MNIVMTQRVAALPARTQMTLVQIARDEIAYIIKEEEIDWDRDLILEYKRGVWEGKFRWSFKPVMLGAKPVTVLFIMFEDEKFED